jgi:multidrug efflux pump subunit AcrA (membrane-fusion protein)
MFQACNRLNEAKTTSEQNTEPPQVLNDGTEIVFSQFSSDLQQFSIDTVRDTLMKLTITAPVHNLVCVVKSDIISKKLYLFETQDITDLYSNYLTSTAAMEHSSKALQRISNLYAHSIVATKDLQDAQQDYTTNQSNLANSISKLSAAGIDSKALEQAAAGTVWAIADFDEEQLANIKRGSKVQLEYSAYPGEKFFGIILSIGEVIDPNTRKVKVRITIINPEGKLHPGMFGSAVFFEGQLKVVAIPSTSVVREDNGTMSVWTTTDYHHFIKRVVKIGQQIDGFYQIIEGIRPEELVVARGGIFLSNMTQEQPTD